MLFLYVFKTQSSRYLLDVIPKTKRAYITRNYGKLLHFKVKDHYFRNFFFNLTVIECNKLDLNICNSVRLSLTSFKGNILKSIRPSENSVFLCNNPKGLKLVTWLRLDLSHLWEHKFKHNFQDTLNLICNCS